ncbi:hypothetical protein [Larkinella punicea]|uniref:Uncharacterized protein n=1 Tax=Larkinella punicea TaxID=2315727 RepID=A0A368JKC3_9BACT|nr:hypothetical protein [Larkinella punicea]RCR67003.1 hypothetical protein DUE52_23380 [Larkinella punicea]
MNNSNHNPKLINQKEAKRLIEQLAFEKPVDSEHRCFTRYAFILSRLWIKVGDLDLAASIFMAVVNQANKLDKSFDWINNELGFELVAAEQKGRRGALLQQRLWEDAGSDEALDLFNERLERFNNFGPNSLPF